MEKILVNIDFKQDSAALLTKAARLALQHNARVELFCCCYNRSIKHGYLFDKAEEQKAEHAYVRQIESRLEALCQGLQVEGVEAEFDACWNRHTGEGVVRKVLRYQPDLLLHPVAPHSRIGHYLFAPVDWQIARKCPVPVLFVKNTPWPDHCRIVACIDPLHEGDQRALLDRELLSRSRGFVGDEFTELRVLHCYNTLPHEAIFDEHVVTDYEALQDRVEKTHLSTCNGILEEFGLSSDSYLVDIIKGEADLTISNYARHNQVDIVAMGAVARSVLDRWLVGSTMEYVVDHVDCDVLIVKHPDFVCPVAE
ncbi:universal stress protein [Neptuniibacter halophilus]|uniref:universal stress protein n=1 Tax=Neptuniibacter halophilus TaxID=651666 RepID=UPI002573E453|nr:universal stress protein [Neptuniibacter halophilus]